MIDHCVKRIRKRSGWRIGDKEDDEEEEEAKKK